MHVATINPTAKMDATITENLFIVVWFSVKIQKKQKERFTSISEIRPKELGNPDR